MGQNIRQLFCAFQLPANTEDRFFMWIPSVLHKSGTLMDNKCSAWTGIWSQVVHNHSNHQGIIPLYFGRLQFNILTSFPHNIGRTGFTIVVCHPSCFQIILNQSFLIKLIILMVQLKNIDAHELLYTTLFVNPPVILVTILVKRPKYCMHLVLIYSKDFTFINIGNIDNFIWN